MNCDSTTMASGTGILPWNLTGGGVSRWPPPPNVLTTVNGEPLQTAVLRNGDTITIGSARLQFWLAAAPQHSLRLRETFVWVLLAAVTAGQFVLIYGLLR